MRIFRKQNGFSLVEILIFVIIIVIIAMIAVPKLVESYNRAQEEKVEAPGKIALEASGLSNLRTVVRANETYRTTNGRYADIKALAEAGLLDSTFSGNNAERGGYLISGSVTNSGDGFCVTAVPITEKAARSYGADEKTIVSSLNDGVNPPTCQSGILLANGASPM